MGYNVNHPIVRDGLVFAVDAGYNLSYASRENLANNSTYNATTWTLPNGHATFTTGIDAPDGTNTAVRFTGTNTGEALLRVNHPSITPNGTDSYTVSFFVRYISGTIASNGISTDWNDGGPSGDYTGSLSLNTWVRISFTAVATAVARSFVDVISNTNTNRVIDFWGLQVEKSPTVTTYTPTNGSVLSRGTTWNNLNTSISNGEFVNSPIFNSSNLGQFQFNATNYVRIPNSTALDTQTPTVEVWVKTNATNQNGFWFEKGDVNQQYSLFQEGGNIIWRQNIGGSISQLVATTASFMNTSNWYQVVATYVSGYRALYINGVLVNSNNGSGTITTNAGGMSIGVYGGYTAALFGRGYFYNGNLAICRVYNKALTPTEIAQNFAAHRGRFGT